MPRPDAPRDDRVVLVEGPWTHRDVSANGARFHVAELGDGPLVLLIHGFPQFWWAMRHQMVAVAEAGYRAVSVDLRGYGGSDKPPRGYDAFTLASDVAGLVRALGEPNAILLGHDLGGTAAWTTSVLHADVVRGLVVLAAAHPRRMRNTLRSDPAQVAASRYLLGFQRPWVPERQLVRDDAALVAKMLRTWSAPGWLDVEAERRYRDHMQILHVPHSVLEYYRWAMRSQVRPDGLRFAKAMKAPVLAPTLQLHGSLDPNVLSRTAQGSGRYVSGSYEWRLIDGAGHFLQEEAAKVVNAEILRWLDELDRTR
jgi:pimeloyl-ACP methyl ester carboxylesterase